MSGFEIPADSKFRNHLGFLCTYLLCYYQLADDDKVPTFTDTSLITIEDISDFQSLLVDADAGEPIPVTEQQMLFSYILFRYTNLILVSQYDMITYQYLAETIPYFDSNINFTGLRTNIIKASEHYAKNIENLLSDSSALADVKNHIRYSEIR